MTHPCEIQLGSALLQGKTRHKRQVDPDISYSNIHEELVVSNPTSLPFKFPSSKNILVNRKRNHPRQHQHDIKSPSLPRRLDRLNNFLNNTRIAQRADVAKLVLLAGQDLAQDATHDLTRARLGQVGDTEDRFGSSEGTDGFPDLADEFLAQLVAGLIALLDADESVDGLAGEFVVDTDDSGLADSVVFD
jgi:hypothetical protein